MSLDGLALFMYGRWNVAECLMRCDIEAWETEYKGKRMKKSDPLVCYIDEQVLMLDPYLLLPADRVVGVDEVGNNSFM